MRRAGSNQVPLVVTFFRVSEGLKKLNENDRIRGTSKLHASIAFIR